MHIIHGDYLVKGKNVQGTTNEKVEDVLTKAEKRLESITAEDKFDRYGKHLADGRQSELNKICSKIDRSCFIRR